MVEYKNLKVKPETFERFKETQPDGVTVDYHMKELLDAYEYMTVEEYDD